MQRVLLSACLMGRKVRYDGSDKLDGHPILERWHAEGRLVLICPEVAAGFGTPRPPAEIVDATDGNDFILGEGRVVEDSGRDVPGLYLIAGQIALEVAQENGCEFAVLTD